MRRQRFEQVHEPTARVTVAETGKTKEAQTGSGAGPAQEHLSRILKAK